MRNQPYSPLVTRNCHITVMSLFSFARHESQLFMGFGSQLQKPFHALQQKLQEWRAQSTCCPPFSFCVACRTACHWLACLSTCKLLLFMRIMLWLCTIVGIEASFGNRWCQGTGGGEKKNSSTVAFFSGGYPRRGGGTKIFREFFPSPPHVPTLQVTAVVSKCHFQC